MSVAAHDPSRSSWYVDDDFYRRLAEDFSGFAREDRALHDPTTVESCRALLAREARLLDEGRFEDWLALYVPECLYWVPGTPGGDPRREIAVAFDDRRQLEGRIYRLRTGHAWSQVPASRTVRVLGNVEAFAASGDDCMVRATFMLTEFRAGESRLLSGWTAHRLVRRDEGWRIAVKQVNLLECDRNLRNPSFIL